MKTIGLLITGFVFYGNIVTAQDNYYSIDNKALRIPAALTYSSDSIAWYITQNFSTDIEKTRALYTWITHNIAYNKDSITHFNRWGIDPEINMAAILRRRKGVCENYAALFTHLLKKSGVQAVMVTGYTNLPANNFWNGHGWVAVKTNEEWLLCDPTWDAGYNSYKYFLVPPREFIETHIPFDPLWQLLPQPVSHKNFQKGRFRPAKADTTIYNFKDSITAYLQLDTLQQMQASARRIQQSGFDNEDVKTWYNYNQMKVHIVMQEENLQLFNDAVKNLNIAKKLYNEFVQYRNNNFSPPRKEQDIQSLFSLAKKHTNDAFKLTEQIGKKADNYQYDTEGLQQSLQLLNENIAAQETSWKQQLLETAKKPL